MRKNWKRLIALFLATVMVVASGIFTTYQPFNATDTDAYVENLDESVEEVDLSEMGLAEENGDVVPEDGTVETTEELQLTEEEVVPEDAATSEETPDALEGDEAVEEATEEALVAEEAEEEAPVVDEAEEEVPAEEVEESYPAVSFDAKTTSGVRVAISAPEGAFPEGTTVTVADVTNADTIAKIEDTAGDDKIVTAVVAVDITFRDAKGKEIEPARAITVIIIPATTLEGSNFSVVHVEDNGTATTVEDKGASAAGATFDADSFSEYALMATMDAANDPNTIIKSWGDDAFTITGTSGTSTWTSSDADIISLSGKGKSSATATINGTGTVTVTHKISNKVNETFTVIVQPYREYKTWNIDEEWTLDYEDDSDYYAVSSNPDVVYVQNQRSGSWLFGYDYYADLYAMSAGTATVQLIYDDMVVAEYYITVSGTYTVTASFNLNGGSGSVASVSATVEEGEDSATITLPEAPARSGYVFLGWADSASATTIQYYAGQEVGISSNKTFYAVWQKVSGQIQYMKLTGVSGSTYSYSKDGNAVSVNNLNEAYTVNREISYSGYWLAGWSTVKPDASYAFVSNRSDFMRNGETIIPREKMHLDQDVLTLYPVFIYNNAQLTIAVRADGVAPREPEVNNDKYYYFAGGDGYPKVSVTKYLNAPYAIFSSGQEMEDVLKDEYFDPDMKDTVADNIYNLRPNFLDTDEEYITFYICKYQMNDKTYHLDGTKRARESAYLDYDVNGGQNKPRSVTTRIGGTATVDNSGITTRTGYRFLTWNTKADGTGTTYAPGSTITLSKDILDSNNRVILYAQWIANTDTKYTVQWIDKDTNAVIKTEERGGTTGKPVEVKDADKTLTGYAFDAENAGNILSGIVAPDESLVLKLYFKKVYTVSYEDTIQSGVTMPDAETVERNATYTVAGNAADFVNDDYIFLGWSTDENATVGTYACGDTFTVTADTVLYAIWLKLDAINEVVTYDGTGHSLNLEAPTGLEVVSTYYITRGIEADGTVIPDTRSETLPKYTNAGMYGFEAYYTVRTGSTTSTVTRVGTLTIKPADVTFTGTDKEKTYDGTPLTADGVTMNVTSGQIYVVDGKGVETWTVSGSQTLVGQSSYTVVPATYTNAKVPYNYNITAIGGKLVVNPTDDATLKYQITLNGTTGEATYTGKAQEHSGLTASANLNLQANNGFFDRIVTSFTGNINYDFTVTDENGVSETYRIVVKADSIKVTGTDAGTYTYTPEILSIKDSSNQDASALFAVTANPGSFVINKAPLTVTSAAGEKAYDGTPLTNDAVTVEGLVNNETVSATATGTITYPGQTANTIQLVWDGTAKENNYAVTKSEGNLVVKTNAHALKLTITANSDSVFYSGAAQEVTGFTTETTRTIGGEDVTAVEATVNIGGENTTYYVVGATAVATGTDAGTYTSTIDTNGVKVYDANGTEVTNEFAVEATPGTLNIKKRNVTITSASASKAYDGSAVTAESIETVTAFDDNGNGFVSGEGVAAYSFTYEDGQAIYAGDNKRNTFNYTLQANTKADNYVITKVAGALVINSAAGAYELTVTASDFSRQYDGTIQTVTNAIENLQSDGRIAATYNGATYYISGYSAKAEGKNAGTYTNALTGEGVRVYDASNRDVTENFTIVPVNGTMTVTKRSVTLTGQPLSKVYDGTALEPTEADVVVGGDGWAAGDGVIYQFSGSQTLVGQSDYSFTYAAKAGTDLATNYDITASGSTLEVTVNDALKYEITVTGNTGSKTYDGSALNVEGYSVNGVDIRTTFGNWIANTFTNTENATGTFTLSAGGEEKTFTISIPKSKITASRTDAGTDTYDWQVSDITITEGGQDVTNQFAITLTGGSAAVTQRSVTLTSATDSKPYDGSALTNDTVTVGGDGWATGEGATYEVTGTTTDPNTSVANAFTYTLNDNTKAGNYDIATAYGTLSITPRATDNLLKATITANSATYTYDGSEKTVSGFVGEEDGAVTVTVGGATYKISGYTASATGTNVADSKATTVTGTLKVTSATGTDVTDQFDVTVVPGTLTINKRNISITSGSDTKAYDGNPLTKHDGIIIGGDGYAEGEEFTYLFSGSRVIPGTAENAFTIADNGKTIQANYIVETHFGTLTVTELTGDERHSVTLTAASGTFTYDGAEHEVSGFAEGTTVDADGNVVVAFGGHNYRIVGYSATAKRTDAGTQTVNLVTSATPTVLDEDDNDVTSNFAITTVPGKLTINQRPVTITSGNASREYNGSALTNDEVTTVGLIDGNTTDITNIRATGSQLYVGSSKNTIAYDILDSVKDNYDIKVVEGDLVVTNRAAAYEITVTAGSAEATYSGAPVTVNTYSTDTLTFDGATYTIEGLSVSASRTDAGTTVTNVTGDAIVRDANRVDVTAQFAITRLTGTINIAKKPLTLKSQTLTKEYDGTALVNDTAALEAETGWVAGEGATYTFSGSQTIVGSTPNAFTIVPNAGTNLENYNIAKTYGNLVVTNRDAQYGVTVTAKSSIGNVYNGNEVIVETFEGQNDKNDRIPVEAGGRTYYVDGLTAYGSQTDAGQSTVVASGTPVVYDAAEGGNDVSAQFAVTVNNGTVAVVPSQITITGDTEITKLYNGDALVPTMANVTIGGNFYGSDGIANVTFSGSRTLIGESPYAITGWTFTDGTNPNNYTVTATAGKLVVTENTEVQYDITIAGLLASDGVKTEQVYDGTELVVSGYSVNGEATKTTFGNWVANHLTGTDNLESSFTLTTADGNEETFIISVPREKVTARQTSVGVDHYDWTVDDITITNRGNDVTNQFHINLGDGTATVTPKMITITSASDTAIVYDGDSHRRATVTVEGVLSQDMNDVVFTYNGFPSVTDVGETTSNYFEVASMTGAKAGNYTYERVYGQLAVVSRDPSDLLDSTTIVANSGGGTYNGTQQSVSGWQYEVAGKIPFTNNGKTYYVDVTGLTVGATGTNVIDSKNTAYTGSYRIVDAKGVDVTDQFKPVTMNMGRLTITPVALTITSASGEREYNGNVYRLDEASVTSGAFVGEENATYTFTGGRVRIGSVKNTFDYTLVNGALASNYTITPQYGTLNVVNRGITDPDYNITVTALSDSVKYDGTTYEISGWKKGVDEDADAAGIQKTIDGNTYTITGLSASATGTNATDTPIPVNVVGEPKVVDVDGNDVTDSFAIHTEDGALTITKRDVTLTSPDKTYIYDGQPHTITDAEIVVGGDGWADGEGATYNKTSITYVGTKNNDFTYQLTGATLASNYNITTSAGLLTVTDSGDGFDPEKVVDKIIDDATVVYDEGDVVTYTITVTNIYDTAQNIVLTEQAGVTLDQDTFNNVAPGEQVVAHATYTITSADIVAGVYENTVTVNFPDVNKTFSDTEGSAPIATEDANITVAKRLSAVNGVSVAPGDTVIVKVGDELTYTINAVNNGNVDLNNVVVTDDLTGDSWTIGTLAARSTSQDYNAVYTVTAADAVTGYVRNNAKVETSGDDNNSDPSDPTNNIDVDVPVDQNFNVTIHFVNTVGVTVYPDYIGTYKIGDTFTILSPAVAGYTPSVASIASPEGGMPAQDIELTVIYSAIPATPATPTTPTTPTDPTGGAGGDTPGADVTTAGAGAGDAGNLVAVEDVAAPQARINVGDNGDISLVAIDDMETPLANNGLGIMFNILYFLLLIASAITISAYAKSMKKHQLKIQDYEKQLGKRS